MLLGHRGGQAVELIVDFSLCSEYEEESFDVPLRAEYFNTSKPIAALTEFGFTVMLYSRASGRLDVQCEGSFSRFELLDRHHQILSSSDRFGMVSNGDTSIYTLEATNIPLESKRLRVVWQSTAHSFARPPDLP